VAATPAAHPAGTSPLGIRARGPAPEVVGPDVAGTLAAPVMGTLHKHLCAQRCVWDTRGGR